MELKYDLRKKEIHGRLASWIELLMEYDLEV